VYIIRFWMNKTSYYIWDFETSLICCCRHHQHGRWQARIGRVAGNKDLYLGTFSMYSSIIYIFHILTSLALIKYSFYWLFFICKNKIKSTYADPSNIFLFPIFASFFIKLFNLKEYLLLTQPFLILFLLKKEIESKRSRHNTLAR